MFQSEYGCSPFPPPERRDEQYFNQNMAVRYSLRSTAEIDVGLIGMWLLVFPFPERRGL